MLLASKRCWEKGKIAFDQRWPTGRQKKAKRRHKKTLKKAKKKARRNALITSVWLRAKKSENFCWLPMFFLEGFLFSLWFSLCFLIIWFFILVFVLLGSFFYVTFTVIWKLFGNRHCLAFPVGPAQQYIFGAAPFLIIILLLLLLLIFPLAAESIKNILL